MNNQPDNEEIVDITWGMIIKKLVLPVLGMSATIILLLVAVYLWLWA